MSPSINNSGSLLVTGGIGGTGAGPGTLTSAFKIGGCSGAAILGIGGQGSFESSDGSYSAALNGGTPAAILSEEDPSDLF